MSEFGLFLVKMTENDCKNCKVSCRQPQRRSRTKTDLWEGSGDWFWGSRKGFWVPG